MCDPIDKSEVHRENWNGIEWKVSIYWKIGNWSPELMFFHDYVTTYSNYIYILYVHRCAKSAKIHSTHRGSEDPGPAKIAQGFCRPKRKVETKILYIAHKDTHLYSIRLFANTVFLFTYTRYTCIQASSNISAILVSSTLLKTQNVLD